MNTRPPSTRRALAGALAALALLGAGCGEEDPPAGPQSITLVAYDSFPTSASEPTPVDKALAEFTDQTQITVKVLKAGDTGTMVTKARLTAGNPEGDVIWGVDNTFMGAAREGRIFDGEPAKVDTGDVCVNTDLRWFSTKGLATPESLDDLIKPEYKDLLVVEDPTSSSPGLAFLLATIAKYGEDGWVGYWQSLKANGVKVVDSWDTAYYEQFSGAGKGDRPLVVSYGTSPPAEVFYADPPRTEAITGVARGTCFHQEEFAGVLRGTKHRDAARRLVQFLVSERFQRELPLTMFVYPANPKASLPEVFTKFAVKPERAFVMDSAAIDKNRQRWLDAWTLAVQRSG